MQVTDKFMERCSPFWGVWEMQIKLQIDKDVKDIKFS